MSEDLEQNQVENPQDVCSLRFYYPTRQNISKYLKITKFSLENYDWIPPLYFEHQYNCKKMHPQVCFSWFAKRDFRVEPKLVHLMCSDVFDYRCKARLIYQFDEIDNCFYLRQCNNQHHHLLTGAAFFKGIWQKKKQKMQKQANETNLKMSEEQYDNNRKQIGLKNMKMKNGQKQMESNMDSKIKKKPQALKAKIFKK